MTEGSVARQPDLSTCDDEPIHIPGAIQPHGLLLALAADMTVVAASDNLPELTGLAIGDLIGRSAADIFDSETHNRLTIALAEPGAAVGAPIAVGFSVRKGGDFVGSWHRHDQLVFLELEPPQLDVAEPQAFFRRTNSAIRRLQAAETLETACAAAAQEVREITGFDRVMIYRFAPDFSGEVIAENRCAEVESYLGLHFPASDIPAQARRLYTINPVRIIPDINYRPVPVTPSLNPITGRSIDLSFAILRSVSPVHLEYMRNIGMHGTMSISILRGERLWGLIACHHRKPNYVDLDGRQACELVAQVLAWQIGVMEEQAITRQTLKGQAIQRSLINDIEQLHDHRAGLARNSEALLELMGASGLCLHSREGVITIGQTPPSPIIDQLAQLAGRSGGSELFQTDRLSTIIPEASACAEVASGVLAVPLSRTPPRRVMLWFRPEVAQTVYWAGNPDKSVTAESGRLRPRTSFAAWTEQTHGRAIAWQPHEVAAAVEIRDLIIDVILRNTEKLERINTQLARSNEELESFAHVASHDIKEPLRHIEAFAGLLADNIHEMGDERLGVMVSGIEKSSRRLRNLINDLAEFSQLGRRSKPLSWVSLETVLNEVLADLQPRIAEARAEIQADRLPFARCDHNQIRQVLQNLIANSLKYRDPARPCRIHVYAEPDDNGGRPEIGVEPAIRICVTDNGIGFDKKYIDQVFEPFQRLHGPDDYEGSGIGLAICRKIVQRHGGRVGVDTIAGKGSTFWFTLPVAGDHGQDER
ncbi:ATP-binding protein [Rhodopseudomonas sp. BR0G17]|uniref:ATP-binding protein n=1 Tax=Rhodopseudomonas sp. BR0G17 TaxID=2269368 RepID=UPI0013E0E816|nr:ATP-binding protein [Rhodopseudomonas sp. BR0G17]NEW96477.1 GAF domain-containing protein [Rhodopseudomonas sp. BR0G17]